jgi:hypothetical protein
MPDDGRQLGELNNPVDANSDPDSGLTDLRNINMVQILIIKTLIMMVCQMDGKSRSLNRMRMMHHLTRIMMDSAIFRVQVVQTPWSTIIPNQPPVANAEQITCNNRKTYFEWKRSFDRRCHDNILWTS